MGASGWIYYVPYQEDLEQALQELRRHIFVTDQYNHFSEREWIVDINGEEIDASQMQEVIEQEDGSLVPVPPLIFFPKTLEEEMEETVRRTGGQGTHSILDIGHVITDSRYYGDVPLPEEIIQDIFAWVRPTRATLSTITSQEQIWPRVTGWFGAERTHIDMGLKASRIYNFSDEMLQFFAAEHSQEEIIEMLLTRDDLWLKIHRCLTSEIERLAMWTRCGKAMPFSAGDFLSFFGTEKPSRAEAEAVFEQREIWENMRRSTGYYAIIYQNDVPHEIVFAGFSGD